MEGNDGFDNLSVNFIFHQEAIIHNINNEECNFSSSDILLDSGSSCSILNNDEILENIVDSEITLRCHTNGGHHHSHKEGYFPGFLYVWYNPMSMLNILSFAEVRNKFRITMDTNNETSMTVHLKNNKIVIFDEVSSGLYLFKGKHKVMNEHIMSKQSYLCTVIENKAKFSNRHVIMADESRYLFVNLGMPSYDNFIKTLTNNDIRNLKGTVDDAKRVVFIY